MGGGCKSQRRERKIINEKEGGRYSSKEDRKDLLSSKKWSNIAEKFELLPSLRRTPSPPPPLSLSLLLFRNFGMFS